MILGSVTHTVIKTIILYHTDMYRSTALVYAPSMALNDWIRLDCLASLKAQCDCNKIIISATVLSLMIYCWKYFATFLYYQAQTLVPQIKLHFVTMDVQ